jgi:hypothetical protein
LILILLLLITLYLAFDTFWSLDFFFNFFLRYFIQFDFYLIWSLYL